jgi:hypothetical protein
VADLEARRTPRVCAEAELRPNLCEVTCRRETVGRVPCEVVCDLPRVVIGFDGAAPAAESVIWAIDEGHIWAPEQVDLAVKLAGVRESIASHKDAWAFPPTPVAPAMKSMSEYVSELAAAYVRPTLFNQPIGVDREGTEVYWSDIVDENIAAADVRITL